MFVVCHKLSICFLAAFVTWLYREELYYNCSYAHYISSTSASQRVQEHACTCNVCKAFSLTTVTLTTCKAILVKGLIVYSGNVRKKIKYKEDITWPCRDKKNKIKLTINFVRHTMPYSNLIIVSTSKHPTKKFKYGNIQSYGSVLLIRQ